MHPFFQGVTHCYSVMDVEFNKKHTIYCMVLIIWYFAVLSSSFSLQYESSRHFCCGNSLETIKTNATYDVGLRSLVSVNQP